MRLLQPLTLLSLLAPVQARPDQQQAQHHLQPALHHDSNHRPRGVSAPFFASLERTSRLVDITYCVGTTGISPPFSCASRCKDFPSLHLVRTWNTGVLLSDSCGYIAVDHGPRHAGLSTSSSGKQGDGGGRGEIIVAFRGTYSITNTIVDLSTVPQEYVPYPAPPSAPPGDGNGDGNEDEDGTRRCDNCTVHMGFMASWRNAREVVLPALQAARDRYPGYRVHLVGHSLGGAVAALAALELRLGRGWGDDVLVTTFGEPRVGNAHLAEYIDRAFGLLPDDDDDDDDDDKRPGEDLAYRRVTHAGDPVPLLPLTEWGYRAHAGEVYIAKSALPPAPEDLRLCRGRDDAECLGGAETADWLSWVTGLVRREKLREEMEEENERGASLGRRGFPARFKLWQLLFAHRDYFWRLGLCLPGGDPADWGREKYNLTEPADGGPEPQDL